MVVVEEGLSFFSENCSIFFGETASAKKLLLLLLHAGLEVCVLLVVEPLWWWLLTKWLFCSICCPAFSTFIDEVVTFPSLLHAQPIVSGFLEQFLKPSLLSCPLMKLKAKRKKEMKIHSVSAFTLQDLFRYVGQKNNHHDHHKVPRTFLRSTFWPLLLFFAKVV